MDILDFNAAKSFWSEIDTFDQDWKDRALCAQTDPEAFFPEKGGSTREVKKVCASCPVRAECLEYAISENIRHGVWGGLSERERRVLRDLQQRRARRRPQIDQAA